MATETHADVPQTYPDRPPHDPASLDPIETSASRKIPETYAEEYCRQHRPQYVAAHELYSSVFNDHGTAIAHRLHECRTRAWFTRHRETGEVRVAANACGLRWCPMCGNARKQYIRGQIKTWLKSADSPKFLTLTLKHTTAPLASQIEHIYRSWRTLRARKEFKARVRGGFWMFEIKKSKDNQTWHPHLHAILDATYIPHAMIRTLWLAITLTSEIVDIRAVTDPLRAAAYVAKYATKPASLEYLKPQSREEVYKALHGRRLCGTWGTLRSVRLTIPPRTDLDDWEQLGSWRDVTERAGYDIVYRRVWDAWLRRQPLPLEHVPRVIQDVEAYHRIAETIEGPDDIPP